MTASAAVRKSSASRKPAAPKALTRKTARLAKSPAMPPEFAATDAPLVSAELKRTPLRLSASLRAMAGALVKQPRKAADAVTCGAGELAKVVRGQSSVAPAAGDRRFDDPAWRDNPLSHFVLPTRVVQGAVTARRSWPGRHGDAKVAEIR
jgi:hypothetical protein